MLNKIKFKKLWFVLLVLPLVFTPVSNSFREDTPEYLGLTVGPLLAFPTPARNLDNGVPVIGWDWPASGPFDWEMRSGKPKYLFVDWGRIAYWDAWMLAICVVVNRKRLLQDKEE